MSETRYIPMKSIVVQAYLWLAIPVAIFLAAWIRPAISIPLLIGLVWALTAIFRKNTDSPLFRSEGFDHGIRRDRTLLWMALIVVGMLIWCGMGGFISQYKTDGMWRNAVAYDLVKLPWPVEYPPADGEPRILSYYFGFWLPSALGAKIFGNSLIVGDILQILYAAWGVCIVLAFLFSFCHGRRRWLALLLFLFFGVWDIVGALLMFDPSIDPIEYLIYSEVYTGYHWFMAPQQILKSTFNQGIPAMFGMMLLYYQRRNPGWMIFTFVLILFFAPFPCIGAFPALAVWIHMNFRKSLSWPNLLALPLAILFAAFFMSNNNGTGLGVHTDPATLFKIAWRGALWFALSVAIYLPFIWKDVKGNWLFWLLVATALLVPLLHARGTADLGWRACTPMAVMLLMLVVRKGVYVENWLLPRNICFAAVLLIASFEAVSAYALRGYYEVTRVIIAGEPPKETCYDGSLSDSDVTLYADNFVSERSSFFYRHIMRHPETANPDLESSEK